MNTQDLIQNLHVPPLPDPLPFPATLPDFPKPPFHFHSLKGGCYLINYKPIGSKLVTFDGTMRVECHKNGRTASGDLYQRPIIFLPPIPSFPKLNAILPPDPDPAKGIPIFSRKKYCYYLSVTRILETCTLGSSFTLGFDMYRFTKSGSDWSSGGIWTKDQTGPFTAQMTWQAAPAGYTSDYLEGDVKNATGTIVGRLTMGWVSKYLRKATIEIDRVAQSEAPVNNGAGVDWKAVGDGISWDITVDESDSNVAEVSGESWSNAECHAAMLQLRETSNLDAEWRYHVLAVRRLDATERGIMYDTGATDSDKVPRGGVAISSHWVIPNTSEWGLVQGMRFGTASKPYFRTAVHEVGHAMGLYHNTVDLGFLNTTDVIAASATSINQFPNNIQWSYASDDQKRLRHMPDIYVRPGGTPFGVSYAATPVSPTDLCMEADDFKVNVKPLLDVVPLGAPVRVNIELVNIGSQPMLATKTLSMNDGHVRGVVIDPSGKARSFKPLLRCVDEDAAVVLNPDESVCQSVTLLRGGEGALFPVSGTYRIIIEVHWHIGEIEASVSGETDVMITEPVDGAHAQAALKVLSTPDTLLVLVLGGDHLEEGINAIQEALKNPVLKPHFAYIEAKRLGDRFQKREPDIKSVAELIEQSTVMSSSEMKRVAEFAMLVKEGDDSGNNLAMTLKSKVEEMEDSGKIKDIIDSL